MAGVKPTIEFDGQRIDSEAFHQRILKSASALRSAGLGEGDVIALLLPDGPEALEVMLVARWLGALWCPINWHFKTGEVQYILSNSGARLLVAGRRCSAAGAPAGAGHQRPHDPRAQSCGRRLGAHARRSAGPWRSRARATRHDVGNHLLLLLELSQLV